MMTVTVTARNLCIACAYDFLVSRECVRVESFTRHARGPNGNKKAENTCVKYNFSDVLLHETVGCALLEVRDIYL